MPRSMLSPPFEVLGSSAQIYFANTACFSSHLDSYSVCLLDVVEVLCAQFATSAVLVCSSVGVSFRCRAAAAP